MIRDKRSSKSIWESMCQKYQGSTKVKRVQLQALRKEFKLLAMGEALKTTCDEGLLEEEDVGVFMVEANYVEMNKDAEFLLMSCVELDTYKDDDLLIEEVLLMSQEELQQTKKEDLCFLDSGCSNCMIGNKEWLPKLEE
nr:retrovirus-related Pol polyprotein from transposon TNT 1-94 [Tanacetum cinerariifolium]